MLSSKNKIFTSLKLKRYNVFLLFLFLSFSISLLTKLTTTKTQVFSFQIVPFNHLQNEVLKDSTKILDISLTAKAIHFIPFYFGEPNLNLDLGLLLKSDSAYHWKRVQHLGYITEQFPTTIQFNSVQSSDLDFYYDALSTKRVGVEIAADLSFATAYDLSDKLLAYPDTISIIGPKKDLKQISSISTNILVANQLSSNVNQNVDLVFPEKIKALNKFSKQVRVFGQVEKHTEGRLEVPVTFVNVPENFSINYFPKKVSIIFYTSLANYKKITPESFEVLCDFNQIEDSKSLLRAQLISKPDFVKKAKIQDVFIEYILIDNND